MKSVLQEGEVVKDIIDKIEGKTDFINFLNELANDYLTNQEEWANTSVSDFIGQISSWIEDFLDCPQNDIEWEKINYKVLARILYMENYMSRGK